MVLCKGLLGAIGRCADKASFPAPIDQAFSSPSFQASLTDWHASAMASRLARAVCNWRQMTRAQEAELSNDVAETSNTLLVGAMEPSGGISEPDQLKELLKTLVSQAAECSSRFFMDRLFFLANAIRI